MHLKKTKRKGRIYLSIVQNYRVGGHTRSKTIETIGYADDFSQLYADPIAHFQQYVKELNKQQQMHNPPVSLTFNRDAKINPDHVASARWGTALALAYLDALGVHKFFEARAGHEGFPPHAGRIFEMLASERIIHVASKRESWERKASFPRKCNFSLSDIYRSLECFAEHEEGLLRAMNSAYCRIRGPRRQSNIYVVFAAFSFADTGDVDSPEGSLGKRAVGLAMFLDEDTIPVSYRLVAHHPSSEEFAALAREARADTGAARAILIAAHADDPKATMAALQAQGDGFIFYQPLRKASSELKAWVSDAQNYIVAQSGNYKVKSRIEHSPSEGSASVKELVLWGRDFALRAKGRHPDISPRPRTPKEPAKDPEFDGYLCLKTSEIRQSEAVVFHLYREIWRLMEPFQVLESDFSPSPYPTPLEKHVRAHFLICYAAFFALRVLRADMDWKYNAAQVASALLRMEGNYLDENWFLFSYRNEVTDAIEEAAGVDVARRLRTPPQIRRDILRAKEHIERRTGHIKE